MEADSANAACALFLGNWRGLVRMSAALTVQNDEAEIVLIVTKGTTQVDLQNPQFGQTGPGIGNSILVAATFHVALFYLRASGIRFMTNDPVDQISSVFKVAKKLSATGFPSSCPCDSCCRRHRGPSGHLASRRWRTASRGRSGG